MFARVYVYDEIIKNKWVYKYSNIYVGSYVFNIILIY